MSVAAWAWAPGFAALLALLGGQDPTRFQAWRGDAAAARVALSEAFSALEMPRLATAALVESVVLDRKQPAVWAKALGHYPLSLRGQPAAPLVFASLDGVDPAGLTPAAQSRLAFLVGQSLLAAGRPAQARASLLQVAPDSVVWPAAQYLAGVSRVSTEPPDLGAAAAHFKAVVQAAETHPQMTAPLVREARRLALLGLARLFYEAGQYEVALYYYRRLPVDAPERAEVAFETAWAHVMRGDMQRALGAIHGARAPAVRHPGRPELHLVAGAARLALCHYEGGRWELDHLEQTYLMHLPRLETYIKVWRLGGPSEGALAALDADRGLPPRLRYLVREQPAVAHGLRELKAGQAEVTRAQALGGPAATEAVRLGAALAAWHQARTDRAVVVAIHRLVGAFRRMRDARGELLVDLLEAEGEQLTTEIRTGEAATIGLSAPEVPVLGSDWQQWSFDGSWWFDELGSYRSTESSRCAARRSSDAGDD